jgi:hypothetical protein
LKPYKENKLPDIPQTKCKKKIPNAGRRWFMGRIRGMPNF